MRVLRLSCVAAFLLCVLPTLALAQYMYLDANGDGLWTSDDRLKPDTTTVRVWLDTNHDRDGSLRVCNDHTGSTVSTFVVQSSTTLGSTTVVSCDPANRFAKVGVGLGVTGTGIPTGTTVTAKGSDCSLTISAAATATSSGTSGNFLTYSKAITSTRTSGSTTLTCSGLFGPVAVGMTATGTGIPAGTTVTAAASTSSLTISNAATSSGTASVTFSAGSIESDILTGSTNVTAGIFENILPGGLVTGPGIDPGIIVTAKLNRSKLTISSAATATGTSDLTYFKPLDEFAYDLIFKADGGTVLYSPWIPAVGYSWSGTAEIQNDTWATVHRTRNPADNVVGLQLLGWMTVTVTGGSPSISVVDGPAPFDPGFVNSVFGTNCDASTFPNSYVLGAEWSDVDGVGAPLGGGNQAPQLSGPTEMNAVAGTAFTVSVEITDPDEGDVIAAGTSDLPKGLILEQGKAPDGRTIATVRGLIDASASVGDHFVMWGVTDGLHPATAGRTVLHVRKPSDRGSGLEERVRRFVSRDYPYPLPRTGARLLGPAAVPVLIELLRDDRFKRYWGNAVETLAIIGTPETFDSLRAFVWERYHGRVDGLARHALYTAQAAMWGLAATRPEVIDYLEQCTDPDFWGSLPWLGPGDSRSSLSLALSKISINGLSCIVTPKSIRVLKDLKTRRHNPRQLSNIEEGIRRQDEILTMGFDMHLETERRRLMGVGAGR